MRQLAQPGRLQLPPPIRCMRFQFAMALPLQSPTSPHHPANRAPMTAAARSAAWFTVAGQSTLRRLSQHCSAPPPPWSGWIRRPIGWSPDLVPTPRRARLQPFPELPENVAIGAACAIHLVEQAGSDASVRNIQCFVVMPWGTGNTRDRFFLVIEANDPKFKYSEAMQFMKTLGARDVCDVEV